MLGEISTVTHCNNCHSSVLCPEMGIFSLAHLSSSCPWRWWFHWSVYMTPVPVKCRWLKWEVAPHSYFIWAAHLLLPITVFFNGQSQDYAERLLTHKLKGNGLKVKDDTVILHRESGRREVKIEHEREREMLKEENRVREYSDIKKDAAVGNDIAIISGTNFSQVLSNFRHLVHLRQRRLILPGLHHLF